MSVHQESSELELKNFLDAMRIFGMNGFTIAFFPKDFNPVNSQETSFVILRSGCMAAQIPSIATAQDVTASDTPTLEQVKTDGATTGVTKTRMHGKSCRTFCNGQGGVASPTRKSISRWSISLASAPIAKISRGRDRGVGDGRAGHRNGRADARTDNDSGGPHPE